MASTTKQWSRAVLLALFLVISFTSSVSSQEIGILNNEQLEQLADIFRQLNSYFNYNMVGNDQTEDSRQLKQDNVTSQKTSPNEESIHIQERSDSHTPWYCHSDIAWRDLGNLHYPRFVKEIRCSGNACMHGFYNCRPSHYPLRVLSAREESGSISQHAEDSFLPPNLRQNWTMMVVDISVGCVCGN